MKTKSLTIRRARNARDEAASVLAAKLVELRELVTGLYGNATAQEVFREATPQDPVVLSRFAVEVSERLLATALPPPRVAGTQLDKQAIAQDVRAAQAKLKAGLNQVTRELREAQVTLNEKSKAMEAYDRIFRGVATTLTGLFTLAGEEALASKVRPSLRRPGRTQGQEDAELESPPPS